MRARMSRITVMTAVFSALILCLVAAPSAFAHGKPTGERWSAPTNVSPLFTSQCYNSPSYTNCDYYDPTIGSPNCAGSGYLQETAYTTIAGVTTGGWVKNWWSSHCNSNWDQAHANSGFHLFIVQFWWCSVVVTGGPDAGCPASSKYQLYSTANGSWAPGTTSWYTNMFYSPSGTSTKACVDVQSNSDPNYIPTACTSWH